MSAKKNDGQKRGRAMLSRRTMLRGLGAAAASAPFLQSFPSRADGEVPTRLLIVSQSGNYIGPEEWVPAGTGARRALPDRLPRMMRALEPHREDLLIVDGLTGITDGRSKGHYGHLTTLTGAPMIRWAGSSPAAGEAWAGGPSIDQVLGERLGSEPLTLAAWVGADRNDGYGRLSFTDAERPVAPIVDPNQAFDRVFGSFRAEPRADRSRWQARRRSVLDAVAWDFAGLRRRLPAADYLKLDAHLEEIRRLEGELSDMGAPGGSCDPTAPGLMDPTANENHPRVTRTMMDIAVQSLACGARRIATLMIDLPGGRARPTWAEDGIDIDYTGHQINHHWDGNPVGGEVVPGPAVAEANRIAQEAFNFRQMAYLLRRLEETPAEDGSRLLDHTIVMVCKGMGPNHLSQRMPFFIAGNRANGLRTGRYLNFGNDQCGGSRRGTGCTPHNHLLVSLCQMMGLTETDRFGAPDEFLPERHIGSLDLS